jgi:hypothetical protein
MNDKRQPSPLDPAIEELRAKRDLIDGALRVLEALRDGTLMAEVGGATFPLLSTGAALAGPPSPAPQASGNLAPGTFHGMGIQEAVKKLLQIRKRTMNAPELAADLRAGGLDFNPKSIASVLHRSFANGGDVVRKDRGQWGLQEWYPNQRFNRRGED